MGLVHSPDLAADEEVESMRAAVASGQAATQSMLLHLDICKGVACTQAWQTAGT